jgi:hypothetical protein
MEQLLSVNQAAELLGTTVRFPRRLVSLSPAPRRGAPSPLHPRRPPCPHPTVRTRGPDSGRDRGTGRRPDTVAMTRFGPTTDAGAATPAAPPSRLKQLRDANRDTPAGPSGLLLTVIPASSSRPTTAFGGVCPGTSQAQSSSNKLGINWSGDASRSEASSL